MTPGPVTAAGALVRRSSAPPLTGPRHRILRRLSGSVSHPLPLSAARDALRCSGFSDIVWGKDMITCMGSRDEALLDDVLRPDGKLDPRLSTLVGELSGTDAPPADTQLIRRGSNLVFKSESSRLVYRINTIEHFEEFESNLDLIDGLIAAGAPLLGPRGTRDSSIAEDGIFVGTVWPAGIPLSPGDEGVLGRLLAHLHTTTADVKIKNLEIEDRLTGRLRAVAGQVPRSLWRVLRNKSDEAIELLSSLHRHTANNLGVHGPPALLHGDAHIGNAVRVGHSPALVDLDDICLGPRGFDLAPAMVSYRRFHRSGDRWKSFVDEYEAVAGATDWNLVETMMLIREVTMNTWLATLWNISPDAHRELIHRVETWDVPPEEHIPWQAI